MDKRSSGRKNFHVVIDTNVWLSGLVFGGAPGKILELFGNGDLSIAMSEELLSELRRTILQKFPLFVSKLDLLEASIRKDTLLVQLGSVTVKASRDPDDDKFLETALIARCSHVVSGDKDLLSIRSFEGIQIVTATEFLNIFI